jgi:hypothetical protein
MLDKLEGGSVGGVLMVNLQPYRQLKDLNTTCITAALRLGNVAHGLCFGYKRYSTFHVDDKKHI